MRIAMCLDKFRGSLTAVEASKALQAGILSARPAIEVRTAPVADGGEGTIDALESAGFIRHAAVVRGPLGAAVRACFAVRPPQAVVELAQASGLSLTAESPDPLRASTFGTGELVGAVLDLGFREITLAVGGSASTDGGAGMLQALGALLLDAKGRPIPPGGAGLALLDRIDLGALDPRLEHTEMTLATDVDNPLLGANGAAAVFGPQKGATSADVALLDDALTRFADLIRVAVDADHAGSAGAGAAGGVGFAALAGLRARRVAGVDVILRAMRIADTIAGSDLVIVGEGCLDEQSLRGKAPIGVAGVARQQGVPVVAVAGQLRLSPRQLARAGITRAYSILERAGDISTAMGQPIRFLDAIGGDIATWASDGAGRQ